MSEIVTDEGVEERDWDIIGDGVTVHDALEIPEIVVEIWGDWLEAVRVTEEVEAITVQNR